MTGGSLSPWLSVGGMAVLVAVTALTLPWGDWAQGRSAPSAERMRRAGLLPVPAAAIIRKDLDFHAERSDDEPESLECLGYRRVSLSPTRPGWVKIWTLSDIPAEWVFVDDMSGLEDRCARNWRLNLGTRDGYRRGRADQRF